MNVGLFLMPLHPPEKPPGRSFEEDASTVVVAEELGYVEAWVGQHTSLAWQPVVASDLFLAGLVPRTRRIRLGTAVVPLPQHHPVNVASRLAMLDHLSQGRLSCGFGLGGVPTDHELFDLPSLEVQHEMMEEALDMVLALWMEDPPFTLRGRFWQIETRDPQPELGVGALLKPCQKPHPPVALAAFDRLSRSARLAGRRGHALLSSHMAPGDTLRQHWQSCEEGSAEAGRPAPDRAGWRIARHVVVGRSRAEAWELASGSLGPSYDYMLRFLASVNRLDRLGRSGAAAPVTRQGVLEDLCIIGDVDDCIRRLEALWEETGGFGTLLLVTCDCNDLSGWSTSMELLAHKVAPALPAF